MLSTAVQILAFALAVLGVVGATVATLLPNWQVSIKVWSSMVAPMWHTRGLWMDCVWYSAGVFSCTMKNSLLSLPPYLQTTRAAMVLSCIVAVFGLCLASLGLKCTRWGGSHQAKGHTAIAAGACFILASALCIGPASWFTSEVVAAFLSTDLPDGSKYQPGGALCVTFLSAGFLLAGGVIFCLSCPGQGSVQLDYPSPVDPDRFILTREKRRRPKTADMTDMTAQKKTYVFLSKVSPKDLKDSYTLQEYV
ncbi:claudin-20-like [Entelurus aequoreus]|uniref:claudin-20-like n=1 Tax=Entelurus aequoreus TaxID=161455 RepID=UPI002B1D6E92|nr:claudin-20-like [Entelurus aequoreus]